MNWVLLICMWALAALGIGGLVWMVEQVKNPDSHTKGVQKAFKPR